MTGSSGAVAAVRSARGDVLRAVVVAVFVVAGLVPGCAEDKSLCRSFLEGMLENDEPTGAPGRIELVITFEGETPDEVIDDVLARCGGEVVSPRYPRTYVTVAFTEEGAAGEAADCYEAATSVAVCLPNTVVYASDGSGR